MEYKLIEDTDFLDFHEKVEKAIAMGWKPQGGVSVCSLYENEFAYFQAMVRSV